MFLYMSAASNLLSRNLSGLHSSGSSQPPLLMLHPCTLMITWPRSKHWIICVRVSNFPQFRLGPCSLPVWWSHGPIFEVEVRQKNGAAASHGTQCSCTEAEEVDPRGPCPHRTPPGSPGRDGPAVTHHEKCGVNISSGYICMRTSIDRTYAGEQQVTLKSSLAFLFFRVFGKPVAEVVSALSKIASHTGIVNCSSVNAFSAARCLDRIPSPAFHKRWSVNKHIRIESKSKIPPLKAATWINSSHIAARDSFQPLVD